MNTVLRRSAAVGGLTGAAVLIAAVPAFAHVSVQPASAEKGSYSTVAFKVPNEEDSANTIKVADTTARVLAVVGIVIGVLGVAYGVLTGRRRDSTTPSA
jgi:beta-lactamase regulating signal transducer with metallopeptidase domain